MTRKCVICDKRPWATEDGYCHICADKLNAERRRKRNRKPTPDKYLVYKGAVVGLFKNGNGDFVPKLVHKAIKALPKCRTINLDGWCDGYSRKQIKAMKATVKNAVRIGICA